MTQTIDVISFVRTDPQRGAVHALRSEYVERFYLPALGPSATMLLRFADALLEETGGRQVRIGRYELATSCAIPKGRVVHTARRAAQFLPARIEEGPGAVVLWIPPSVPPVREKLRTFWSPTVQALHDQETYGAPYPVPPSSAHIS